ncbi:PQQ-like beta-propeller repeat protein [Stieleria sp. TO1_6]|uniref:PQQ-binding-like beta-propeller repeat protein n=1 Tax=Stieleria tagensis TaxID=2956795 RepID=UPI00209B75D6|nr:PQQ-binding-like beta-propeller repeat protein [Stieleria tagensis]MCO8123391.1 PQQ-like beta-propeller repeat protein [Stieleria tagensis]
MTRCYRYALSFVTGFILLVGHCGADEWPQYRGPAGDGKSTETIGEVDWSSGQPDVLWKTETPLGFSSPAVADGRMFTLISADDQEFCLALDANSGKELWRVALGSSDYEHDGGNAGAPDNRGGDGPRSTPTVVGSNVYVYTAQLALFCLNAETGAPIWKHDIVDEFAGRNIKWRNASSPIVADNLVIVGGGGAGESFLAFNKDDGQVVWKSGDETITHATPTLTTIADTKQIIFFVQSGLVAADPTTGKELWRAEFPFSVSTAASPVVSGDKVYCSAGYGVGAGLFQIQSNAKAEELWFKPNELMNHWSTPVVHNGHLYGMFEFKKYGKAPLQCVELATGEIKWEHRGFGPGNCILVGDKLVALSDAGEVVIAAAQPGEYQELARAKVLEGKCWSTPAFSNGRIYVRSTEQAAAIAVD